MKLPRSRRLGMTATNEQGRIVLQGEVEWLVEGTPAELDPIAAALSGLCERLDDQLLLINFGNAVGLFELPGLGTLEVVSGKWDRRHFDAMLADLTAVASALPFAAGVAAA